MTDHVIQVRGLKRVSLTNITAEVLHESLGWIPFSADSEELSWNPYTKAVFAYIKDEGISIESLPECPSVQAGLLASERHWRDDELARADIELLKAEDGEGAGTPIEWRTYRKALRAWPQQPEFPDQSHRPVAPDAIKETVQ